MDLETVGPLAAWAGALPVLIAMIKTAINIPDRIIPLLCLGLTAAFGVTWMMWGTGDRPDPFAMIISVILVAASASGLREWTNTARNK